MGARSLARGKTPGGELLIREMGIGYQLRRSFMALHRRLSASARPHGITPDQYVVLWVLNAWGPQSQRELYQRIYSDGNTVVQMLRRMEARGWIRRVRDERDGRAVRVSLTAKGQALRKKIFQLARRNHELALRGFTGPEREKFIDYLFRFYRALDPGSSERSD
jgi:DNA-binding MarR family transcriptional regulator